MVLQPDDFEIVVDALLEGLQVIGRDWRYLYVNETAARHGRQPREALLGRTMMECYPGIEHTEVFGLLRSSLEHDRTHVLENTFTFADGSCGYFELRIQPVPQGVCVLSLDIGERRRAADALFRSQEQFRQAQKMEAVGRLAGGVAHDFNNLLSVVLSHADILLRDLRIGDPLRGPITEILRAGERAASLTQQLLAFSRRQVLETKAIDLDAVLAGMAPMLGRLVGEDIEITVHSHAGLWACTADPGQLEQVVMNLAVNARDAMPRGGRISIETANVELDADYAAQHPDVRPGPYVMLAVTDTGEGMDEQTKARIFEPFYTTKEKGRGTGLGLATVFGIVTQSKGHISVESEPSQGATFKIYLPRTSAAPVNLATPTRTTPIGPGSETLLLVEDDEQVRTVIRRLLRQHGYRVLEATNAGDALLLAEQHDSRIDLLLTDVVMPRMNGRQLAARLCRSRPGLRVLYVSGYTENTILRQGVLHDGIQLLQKPITPDALLSRVREVLDMPQPPAY